METVASADGVQQDELGDDTVNRGNGEEEAGDNEGQGQAQEEAVPEPQAWRERPRKRMFICFGVVSASYAAWPIRDRTLCAYRIHRQRSHMYPTVRCCNRSRWFKTLSRLCMSFPLAVAALSAAAELSMLATAEVVAGIRLLVLISYRPNKK